MNKNLFFKLLFLFLFVTLCLIVKNKIRKKDYFFLLKNSVLNKTDYLINGFDISSIPIKNCKKNFKGNIWLISYSDGEEIHHKNQNVANASGMINCVNRIIMYKKEDIDEVFYKKNKKILDSHRGAGYWLWKPYFINKTLNHISQDDYLIYVDSGIKINDNMVKAIENILIKNNKEMTLIELNSFLITNIKRSVLKYFDIDKKEFLYSRRLNNHFIIMKNTANVRNFYKKLLKYSQIPELIMDNTDKKDEYSEFKDHSHDIAILAGLYYKYYKNNNFILLQNHNIDIFSNFHRRDPKKRIPLIGAVRFLDQDKDYPHDKNFHLVEKYTK